MSRDGIERNMGQAWRICPVLRDILGFAWPKQHSDAGLCGQRRPNVAVGKCERGQACHRQAISEWRACGRTLPSLAFPGSVSTNFLSLMVGHRVYFTSLLERSLDGDCVVSEQCNMISADCATDHMRLWRGLSLNPTKNELLTKLCSLHR